MSHYRRTVRRWCTLALVSVSTAGCMMAHRPPQLIPPAVETIDFLGSNDFIITRPYVYRIGSTDTLLVVPQGFVTDFASIPRGWRWLLPRQSDYSRAAVLHDYLYWSQICTKAEADNVLYIAMTELGVADWKKRTIYEGVSLGGAPAWNQNGAERRAGEPKVVPPQYFALANTMTWPQARQRLILAHVSDPPFPPNPAACAVGDGKVVP